MKQKTTAQFCEEAMDIHGDKYDYSLVQYAGVHTKVTIICKKHGPFEQTPNIHLSKRCGCRACQYELLASQSTSTGEQFISQARSVHDDRYDYTLVNYVNTHTKVKIICPVHGVFEQKPNSHISGKYGCRQCGRDVTAQQLRSTTNNFINKSREVHGDKYSYDLVKYTAATSKVRIVCKYHGAFEQQPNNHLSGQGCPDCSPTYSKAEQAWLDALCIPNDGDHRQVRIKCSDRTYVVDGFDPTDNTVYEFWGDYWHGNPSVYNPFDINPSVGLTFQELYNKTMYKIHQLTSHGFTVRGVWESEWKQTCIQQEAKREKQ